MSLIARSVSRWARALVDLLVASGALAPEDGSRALVEAAESGTSVVVLLDGRGSVDAATCLRYLAGISGLATVDLATSPPQPAALLTMPFILARQYAAIGYRLEEGQLVIACVEPLDADDLRAVEAGLGGPVSRCVLANARIIVRTIEELASRDSESAGVSSAGGAADAALHGGTTGVKPVAPTATMGRLPVNEETPSLDQLLMIAVDQGASDLHLSAQFPPAIRVDGAIRPIAALRPLEASELREMVFGALPTVQRERFEATRELDTAYSLPGIGRFRVSVFQQRGNVGAVLRMIPDSIPAFDSLGLPDVLASFATLRRGLVLVTGPTGSGKSTTLASVVDIINRSKPLHIMTVEDPIEFIHAHGTAIVNQREVGVDTKSFADSLRHVLRQDPDVILVGEMRDLETISTALTAAETGHLVFSTLHTQDAPQTIDRIIDVFPDSQQSQIRMQLASALEAVVTQQLVIGRSGSGRVPVTEVMVCTAGVKNLIRTAKTHQLYSLIQTGGDAGMQTMDQSLAKAVMAGQITESVAFDRSHDPNELRDYLRSGALEKKRS
ncbi:MAG TPA: PilT/PilU family type 4a pilus ATPase [Acidimicrobiales bacterium]|nr:PilT/PilU family type 4a pilus ATPase [Acidimicrobiales bacterium]